MPKFIADFHIHSKYSRATSLQMDLEHLDSAAQKKGIKVLATGDFTHPEWFANLKEKLVPAEPGLFRIKKQEAGSRNEGTRFVLTSEISCIYSKNNRVRKIHLLIFSPDFETVEKINVQLGWIGNLKSDGRPILGMEAKELAKIALQTNQDCLVVPSHLMTPWFSLFGSKSGFDSLEECFEKYSKYIYAGETGLSASPEMLWRMPDGRRITLISNGDAHSPAKLGREANVFETDLSYPAIMSAIKAKDRQKFLYTIEFFPEEGKYHYDGHRACNVSFSPAETKKHNGICPVCSRSLTIGVFNRVEELADKPEGYRPNNAIPFKSSIPLQEIIAEAKGMGVVSKEVGKEYEDLVNNFGSEFNVLLNASESDLKQETLPEIAEGIIRMRQGKVNIEPGYDGVFGKIRLFSQGEQRKISPQKTLF